MILDYRIETAEGGWKICERGDVVATLGDLREALELAELLALCARAAGGRSTVTMPAEVSSVFPLDARSAVQVV